MNTYIMNPDGSFYQELDQLKFQGWFGNFNNRNVKQTSIVQYPLADCRVKSRILIAKVSTVFLGYDHNWHDDDQPILFETMVFDSKLPDFVNYQARYKTYKHALLGHDQLVDEIKRAYG